MTNLENMIKHYTKEAKKNPAPTAAAYACGVAHTLASIKEVRDGLMAEAKELWKTRKKSKAIEERVRSVELIEAIIERIDEMRDPQE
jgi:hypothetical protein